MSTLVANSPPPIPTIHNNLYSAAPASPTFSPKTQAPAIQTDLSLKSNSEETKSLDVSSESPVHEPAPITLTSKDVSTSLRPAKDVASFLSLLPPAVEFVEGSSTGTFASELEGRYEPINASPKLASPASPSSETRPKTPQMPVKKTAKTATSVLHSDPIDLSWPPDMKRGSGLINTGNTCFLNSALQCLLHTPPLLRMLISHKKTDCRSKSFCMSCAMGEIMTSSFGKSRPFSPLPVTRNLNLIAKHMRRGRQEDAHEFLRYAIDSLQKSCLAGFPPKLEQKVAETSWVHRIFGGQLRSRVTCHVCGHHSDTFDSILDLSIDVYNMPSLKDALKKFTAKDYLKGADKYKCEKCKKPVNAEKSFTVHEAPRVLTVHLKRFTPMGRKLQNPVRYDERLSLQSAMSEGQFGPTYTLYGVISHMGGGPNSGHYFAHVRGGDGVWYEMNDDSATKAQRPEPFNMKNAYILFYIREKGQELEAALNSSVINGKKRKNTDGDEGEESEKDSADEGDETSNVSWKAASKTFIGPVIPAHLKATSVNGAKGFLAKSTGTRFEDTLRKKIEDAEKKKKAQVHRADSPRKLDPLVDYADDDEDSDSEEKGERVDRDSLMRSDSKVTLTSVNGVDGSSSIPPSSLPASSPTEEQMGDTSARLPPLSSSPILTPTTGSRSAINPSQFYATSSSLRKRKSIHADQNDDEDESEEEEESSSSLEKSKNKSSSSSSSLRKKKKNAAGPPPSSWKSRQSKRHSYNGGASEFGSNPFGKGRFSLGGPGAGAGEDKDRREERELFRPRKLLKNRFGRRSGI